jgi:DNA-directed RNA polymerase
MTFGYGGTQYGFTDQLRAHFRDIGESGRLDQLFHLEGEERSHYWMALRVLAAVIYEGLSEVVPGAFAVREWLQGVASEATVNGATLIKWTVPGTGFPVHQQYNVTTSKQIKTRLSGGVLIWPRVGVVLPDTDARKHRNGIAPNYIHSLDAAHLCLTVDCMEGVPINAVHDSYGAHAANVPKLAACLRATFLGLYSDEVATKLQREIGATDAPPHVGDLDLTTVMSAEYFFA